MIDNDYRPLTISGGYRTRNRRRRSVKRWIAWAFAVVFTPTVLMAAYQPSFMIGANNLSELASASSARTNLGLGTIATQNSNNVAVTGGAIDGTPVGATTRSSVRGTTADFSGNVTTAIADTNCVKSNAGVLASAGGPCGVGYTYTLYTSNTATVTLANTNNLFEAIAQGTPAALTVTLNATGLSAGYTQCVKDKANTAATNNITVKTSDSSTIDSVSGATGYVMNQTKQFNCFVFDGGTNWMVI